MSLAVSTQEFCSKNLVDSKANTSMVSILENITKNPDEPKFRKINTEKVMKKVGEVEGMKLLQVVGFTKISDTHWELSTPDTSLLGQVLRSLRRDSATDQTIEVVQPDRLGDTGDTKSIEVPETSEPESEIPEESVQPTTKEETKVAKKPSKTPRSFAERGGVQSSGIDIEAELDRRFSDGSSKYSNKSSKKKAGISGMDLNAAVDKLGGDDKYTRNMRSGKKIQKSGIVDLAESIDGVQHKKVLTTRKKGPCISNLDAAIDGDTSKTIQKRKATKAKVNPSMLDSALEAM